ncbi:hypothetical protein YC2023_121766 [Brassica napus]
MAGSNCGCGSACKCGDSCRRTTTRSVTTAAAGQTVAVETTAAVEGKPHACRKTGRNMCLMLRYVKTNMRLDLDLESRHGIPFCFLYHFEFLKPSRLFLLLMVVLLKFISELVTLLSGIITITTNKKFQAYRELI